MDESGKEDERSNGREERLGESLEEGRRIVGNLTSYTCTVGVPYGAVPTPASPPEKRRYRSTVSAIQYCTGATQVNQPLYILRTEYRLKSYIHRSYVLDCPFGCGEQRDKDATQELQSLLSTNHLISRIVCFLRPLCDMRHIRHPLT